MAILEPILPVLLDRVTHPLRMRQARHFMIGCLNTGCGSPALLIDITLETAMRHIFLQMGSLRLALTTWLSRLPLSTTRSQAGLMTPLILVESELTTMPPYAIVNLTRRFQRHRNHGNLGTRNQAGMPLLNSYETLHPLKPCISF